jgi:hypothetical protein
MFITTKAVYQMTAAGYILVHQEGFDYVGPVAICKGDSTAEQTEKAQAAFTQTLQSAFSTQFATQQNTLNFLNNSLQKEVNSPTGYNAQTLAAMRTSATDQIAQQAQDAQRANQNAEDVRGGANLPSGVNEQVNAEEQTAASEAEAGAQEGITTANANLQNSNYWNAINADEGVAAQENGTGTAGAANGAAGTVSSLSQAVTAANGPSIGSVLAGVGTGVAGAAGKAGSFGALFCWLAAASFDEDFETGVKTNIVRNYLWNVWAKNSVVGKVTMWFYSKVGKQAAKSRIIVNLLRPVFDRVLRKAEGCGCLPLPSSV